MNRRKRCAVCLDTKPVNAFYRVKSNADGYMGKCKECRKAQSRENYELKREVIAAERSKRLRDDPAYREQHYARIREWRRTDRGKAVMRESRKAWEVVHAEQWERIKRDNWRRQSAKRTQRRAQQRQQVST